MVGIERLWDNTGGLHLLLFEYVIRAEERKRQEDLLFTWVIESFL